MFIISHIIMLMYYTITTSTQSTHQIILYVPMNLRLALVNNVLNLKTNIMCIQMARVSNYDLNFSITTTPNACSCPLGAPVWNTKTIYTVTGSGGIKPPKLGGHDIRTYQIHLFGLISRQFVRIWNVLWHGHHYAYVIWWCALMM